ncbi:MAG: hypothetical protein AAF358_24540 [Pseudomonadota bacterium]
MNELLLRQLLDGDATALADAAVASLDSGIEPAAVALFEPRMQGPHGHFPLLADAYSRICTDHGLAMNVFHHQQWQSARPQRWHGVFPVVDHLVGAAAPVDQKILAAFSELLGNIVSTCVKRSEAQVAIFPTARFLTLPGITSAIAGAPELRGAVIGVMETTPVPDCEDENLIRESFRSSTQVLAESGKKVLLLAESAAIADWLLAQAFESTEIRVAPYPAAARFDASKSPPSPDNRPRLGALGATRPVHQPESLAGYLLEADISGVDWCVRLDSAHAAQPLGRAPEQLESTLRSRGVTLLSGHLAQSDYDATLAGLDVMLLPYGERYQTIGSGIFLECVCAGVIPLVPAGSTMRALYEDLGGRAPAIDMDAPDGIPRSVDACLAQLPRLRANADEVRSAWLAHEHGPAAWRHAVSELIGYACVG